MGCDAGATLRLRAHTSRLGRRNSNILYQKGLGKENVGLLATQRSASVEFHGSPRTRISTTSPSQVGAGTPKLLASLRHRATPLPAGSSVRDRDALVDREKRKIP